MEERYIVDDRKIGGYLIQDIEACVGKNSEVYIDKFAKLEEKGYSFNWCSTLFGANWFGYRKMWKVVFFFLLFQIISGPLLYFGTGAYIQAIEVENLKMGPIFTMLFSVVLIESIILGLFGDWLYWRHIKKILDSNSCKNRDPKEDFSLVQSSLGDWGGSSIPGLLGAYVASIVIVRIVNTLGVRILDVMVK